MLYKKRLVDRLERYKEEGKLVSQTHEILPLSIWNYSTGTQYKKDWDEITLMCRGLVINNETGEIIARPLPKFFNYEEEPEKVPWITSNYVWIQEKVDGSYFQLFNYKGEWISTSRGSFTSEMCKKGMEIVKSKYNLSRFNTNYNYIGEVIYPENRICVDYKGLQDVIFLSVTKPEKEFMFGPARKHLEEIGVKRDSIIKSEIFYNFNETLYRNLKDKNEKNKEGYVLRFYPSNHRVKIKFKEYVRLHAIMTNTTSYSIWKYNKECGKVPETVLEEIPDELYDWIKELELNLKAEYEAIEFIYKTKCKELKSKFKTKKDFALNIRHVSKFSRSMLFSMYEDKDYSEIIWNAIKPKFEKPFSNER